MTLLEESENTAEFSAMISPIDNSKVRLWYQYFTEVYTIYMQYPQYVIILLWIIEYLKNKSFFFLEAYRPFFFIKSTFEVANSISHDRNIIPSSFNICLVFNLKKKQCFSNILSWKRCSVKIDVRTSPKLYLMLHFLYLKWRTNPLNMRLANDDINFWKIIPPSCVSTF